MVNRFISDIIMLYALVYMLFAFIIASSFPMLSAVYTCAAFISIAVSHFIK